MSTSTISLSPPLARSQGRGTARTKATGVLPEVFLAVFILSDFYKAAVVDVLPVDITVVSGIAVVIASLHRMRVHGWRLPVGIGYLIAFVCASLLPALYADWTPHAVEKVTRFYSVTLIAALAAPIIVRNAMSVRYLAVSITGIGLLMTLASFVASQDVAYDLRVLNVNTISLGRGYAATILALLIVGWGGRLRPVGYVAALFVLIALVSTGNRQGLVATVLTLFCTLPFSSPKMRRRVYLVVGATAATLYFAWSHIAGTVSTFAIKRYSAILTGVDGSTGQRTELWWAAWDGITILGRGWGSFAELGLTGHGGLLHTYPHNIFLEAGYELGIVVSVFLVVAIALALLRVSRYLVQMIKVGSGAPLRAPYVFVLAMILFYVIVSSVSGSLYSNKALFSYVGIGLSVFGHRQAEATRLAK